MRKLSISLTGIIASLIINSAQADDFSVGIGSTFHDRPWVEYKTQVQPMPVIIYEGQHAYFRGLGGGVYLYNEGQHQLSLNAYYQPYSYDPDDSDNVQMKQLDKRKATVMSGVGYRYRHEQLGHIRFELAGDLLDEHQGIVGDLAWLLPINGENWRFTPGVGVMMHSKKFNNYYYGISQEESLVSGLDTYESGHSWSPYLELSYNYKFNHNWRVFASARTMMLSDKVKDSPMVDQKTVNMVGVGFGYYF